MHKITTASFSVVTAILINYDLENHPKTDYYVQMAHQRLIPGVIGTLLCSNLDTLVQGVICSTQTNPADSTYIFTYIGG